MSTSLTIKDGSSGQQVSSSKMSSTSSSTQSSHSSFSSSSSSSVKTSSSMKTTSIKTTSSSSTVCIRAGESSFKDTFGRQQGIADVDAKMKELTSKMDDEFDKVRKEFFHLSALERIGGGKAGDLVTKLDQKSIMDFIDDKDKDKVKFNFDVDEFESESISVKAVGNKVEVHAKKKSRKGDQEQAEEFSRTFEMPRGEPIDPEKVTSSFYKDGVLTVELPVTEALTAS